MEDMWHKRIQLWDASSLGYLWRGDSPQYDVEFVAAIAEST